MAFWPNIAPKSKGSAPQHLQAARPRERKRVWSTGRLFAPAFRPVRFKANQANISRVRLDTLDTPDIGNPSFIFAKDGHWTSWTDTDIPMRMSCPSIQCALWFT